MITKQPLIQFIQSKTPQEVILLACSDEGVLEIAIKHYKQQFAPDIQHQFLLANDSDMDWSQLAANYTTTGLWPTEKTLFHVQLSTPQLPAECAKAMQAIVAQHEHCILFSLAKEPKTLPQNDWKDILTQPKSQALSFWMPFTNQMPQWCQLRSQAYHCEIAADAITLLSQYYENNLFALEQLLARLQFTAQNNYIDAKLLKTDPEVKTRGNHFTLLLAAFEGNEQKIHDLTHRLALKGPDLLSLLGIMVSQLQKAIAIQAHLNRGKTLKEATRGSFWAFHQTSLSALLKRHKPMTLMQILHIAPNVDRLIKQGSCDAAWHLLRQSIYAILKVSSVTSLEAVSFTDY